MPPRAERNISYNAPQVPAFLQKLHAQVNGNRSGGSRGAGPRPGEGDELDEVLAREGIEYSDPADGGADAADDGEEIWEADGAQVVVLKEGRHLTAEEAERLRKEGKEKEQEKEAEKAAAHPQARIATGAPASSSKRKRMQPIGASGKEDDEDDLGRSASTMTKQQPGKRDTLSAAKELIAADKKRRKEDTEAQEKGKVGAKAEDAGKKKKKEMAKEKKKSGKGLSFSFDD